MDSYRQLLLQKGCRELVARSRLQSRVVGLGSGTRHKLDASSGAVQDQAGSSVHQVISISMLARNIQRLVAMLVTSPA